MASYLTMALDPTASTQIRQRLDEPVGDYLIKMLKENEGELQRILISKNISAHQVSISPTVYTFTLANLKSAKRHG